jgi:CRP/FNR family transcriptional regulator, cyclic AMP receptor protein
MRGWVPPYSLELSIGFWQNIEDTTYLGCWGLPMPSPRKLPTEKRRSAKRPKLFDPKAFLAQAGVGRSVRRYSPKQEIFSQGDRADAVFYTQEGRVRLSVVSKQGKEATIVLLGPGDFLGEGCIASDQPARLATATALTHCSVLKIEKSEMLRRLHAEHQFSDLFVAYIVERYNRTQADLVDQLFNSSEKRLARALLILARFGKEGRSEDVVPGVSQETLAEMIGTTRSRVNFFMNKFRKLGFIDYKVKNFRYIVRFLASFCTSSSKSPPPRSALP